MPHAYVSRALTIIACAFLSVADATAAPQLDLLQLNLWSECTHAPTPRQYLVKALADNAPALILFAKINIKQVSRIHT